MTSKNDNNSKPACCPEGSIGAAPVHLQEDEAPQGHMIEIPLPSDDDEDSDKTSSPLVGLQPMPCYCTGAPLEKAAKIVLVFSDVYGMDAGRHKIFCDHLAERLTTEKEAVAVILPDLQRGVPILQPWIDPKTTTTTEGDTPKTTSGISFTKDLVGSFLGSPGMVYRLKRDYPPQKIEQEVFQMILPFLKRKQQSSAKKPLKLSCVGFCFGGWVVGRILGCPANTTMAQNNNQRRGAVFKCGVGIHPSFQPNLIHGELTTTMAERIDQPMLLLPAWNDVDMKPGTKVVDVMTQKRKTIQEKDKENDDEIVVSIEFPSMMHGWVSRGDTRDPAVAAEQERALKLTVDFLQRHS